MKANPKEQAENIVNFYKRYVDPFGAGSAFMTGDEDPERQLKLAKECAVFHVTGILESDPITPAFGEEDLSDCINVAGGYWYDVLNKIQDVK